MDKCFACDKEISKRQIERHHFPTPKRLGGLTTIPLCRTCHDFVDRIPLEDWPVEWWHRCWPEMTTEARLFVLKVFSKFTQEPVDVSGEIVIKV